MAIIIANTGGGNGLGTMLKQSRVNIFHRCTSAGTNAV